MRYKSPDHVIASGELLRRLEASLARLEQPEYELKYVRKMDDSGWPGDYRGRALLAMTQLSKVLDKRCAYLDDLAEDTLEYLSVKGYGGDIVDLSAVNEQQLAGHSWLIRGLMEYGKYRDDARFLEAAKRLLEELYLAVKICFGAYPLPDTKLDAGGPAGEIIGQTKEGWQLSSDCGCVFIALDGLSDYYAQTGDVRAKAAFDALVKRFFELDPVKSGLQTHATLSALRGLMRMYSVDGDANLLKAVKDRFEDYLTHALTLNYANYNWFGRPRWTECCAVVDSYLLSMALWREGLGDRYIEIAERILYNGLMAGQRKNGGFGSDCCLTPDGKVTRLVPHPECYEAFWCCTMRGVEGLTEALRSGVHIEGNRVHITGWNPGKYLFGNVTVDIRGDFPWENRGTVTVFGESDQYSLYLYPADASMEICQGGSAVIREEIPFVMSVNNGETVEAAFDLSVRKVPVASGKMLWKGPLMLDSDKRPLSHRMYMPVEDLKDGIQVII